MTKFWVTEAICQMASNYHNYSSILLLQENTRCYCNVRFTRLILCIYLIYGVRGRERLESEQFRLMTETKFKSQPEEIFLSVLASGNVLLTSLEPGFNPTFLFEKFLIFTAMVEKGYEYRQTIQFK